MMNATLEAPTEVTAVEHKEPAAIQPYLISDDQFLAAMVEAVALKGSQYRYPRTSFDFADPWRQAGQTPLYRNRETGEPSCLIGVALSIIDQGLCPGSEVVKSAASVMQGLASPRVIYAAQMAQAAQDQSTPWMTALAIYRQKYRDYTPERAAALADQQLQMKQMAAYFSSAAVSMSALSDAFASVSKYPSLTFTSDYGFSGKLSVTVS